MAAKRKAKVDVGTMRALVRVDGLDAGVVEMVTGRRYCAVRYGLTVSTHPTCAAAVRALVAAHRRGR